MSKDNMNFNTQNFNQLTMACSQFYGINPVIMGCYPIYADTPEAPIFPNAECVLNWFKNCDNAGMVWVVDLELHAILPAILDSMLERHTEDGKFDNGIRAVWTASTNRSEIDAYRGDNYGTTWVCAPAPFFPIQYAKAWNICEELWNVNYSIE